jgi:hypothetical protein
VDHVQSLEIVPESEVRFVEPDHSGFTDRRPTGPVNRIIVFSDKVGLVAGVQHGRGGFLCRAVRCARKGCVGGLLAAGRVDVTAFRPMPRPLDL